MHIILLFAFAAHAAIYHADITVSVPSEGDPLISGDGVMELLIGEPDTVIQSDVPNLTCSIKDEALIVEFIADANCVVPETATCVYNGDELVLHLHAMPVPSYDRDVLLHGPGIQIVTQPNSLLLRTYTLPGQGHTSGNHPLVRLDGTPWPGMWCEIAQWPDQQFTLAIDVATGAPDGVGYCRTPMDIPVRLIYAQ